MTLVECVRREAGGTLGRLLALATMAGVANVMILASINASAHAERRDLREFAVFVLLIGLYAACARATKRRTTALIESMLHRIKVRVGDLIAQAELATLERERVAEICDLITQNTTFVSDRAPALAALMQSSVIMVFAALYLLWLSAPALSLVALVCGVGAALFVGMRRDFVAYTRQTARIRVAFFERLMDQLAGFKELMFSRARAREVRADVLQASEELRAVSVRSSDLLADGMLVGEGVLFALLAAVVFSLPAAVDVDGRTMTHIVAAVMFVWGPFMGLASGLMPYTRSNVALQQIATLEQRLARAVHADPGSGAAHDPWGDGLEPLAARGLEFCYDAEDGGERFRVGPVDLTLVPGELVFIVGGNGSGKSTLLKALTGLYAPTAGELRYGAVTVRPDNVQSFRERVSAIFSDFHLFGRLYGLADVADAEVANLLARMQLADKVRVEDRTFSTLALSTGQRKRVAMLVALLEDRPICVFDEWAADQDPEFRAYFYDDLLPRLRARGKLVLVVSHDDRYFDRADRVVTMEYGAVRSIRADSRRAVPS